jgi:hypothetical protein
VGVVALVLACSEAPAPVAPGPTSPATGWLWGSVTLLGNYGPSHPSGYVALYSSPDDIPLRVPKYSATLYRRDGAVRVYDFVVANIAPGSYYVRACWTIGCGEYRQPETGALRTVRITAGRLTRLNFGL